MSNAQSRVSPNFFLLLLLSQQIWKGLGTGVEDPDTGFCYDDPRCDPSSSKWGGTCRTGRAQSPILLPASYSYQLDAEDRVRFGISPRYYSSSRFTIKNNGHSIEIALDGGGIRIPIVGGLVQSILNLLFTFPSAFQGQSGTYRFSEAHLHWGDWRNGSEHCFEDLGCSDMELHLVHYHSSYRSKRQAVASGRKDALAVIAVLLNVHSSATPNAVLAPIVENLVGLQNSHKQTGKVKVARSINLSSFLTAQHQVYNYQGSLTTPHNNGDCDETVNWFVMGTPIAIAPSDVAAFRELKQGNGRPMLFNNRPRQELNGRRVSVHNVRFGDFIKISLPNILEQVFPIKF